MQMEEIVATLARHEECLDAFEDWQRRQNGHISELEDKLSDGLSRLEEKFDKKMDRIYVWLVGVLGGVVTSLGLLIVNLMLLRR